MKYNFAHAAVESTNNLLLSDLFTDILSVANQ